MDIFNSIADKARENFEARTAARDKALSRARDLTRFAAHAIRAIHRSEAELADQNLEGARALVQDLKRDLAEFPELYFAGYTQDAIKEFAEASITCALIQNQPMPIPGRAGGGICHLPQRPGRDHRRAAPALPGYPAPRLFSPEAERLLACMDEIYCLLVTLDFPDAITYNLRRHTDLVRGIVERTRADLTLALREQRLQQALQEASAKFGS